MEITSCSRLRTCTALAINLFLSNFLVPLNKRSGCRTRTLDLNLDQFQDVLTRLGSWQSPPSFTPHKYRCDCFGCCTACPGFPTLLVVSRYRPRLQRKCWYFSQNGSRRWLGSSSSKVVRAQESEDPQEVQAKSRSGVSRLVVQASSHRGCCGCIVQELYCEPGQRLLTEPIK